MSSVRRTLLGMGAFSAVSLVLGVLRELVIARDLQASGAADLFFRGLAILGASRAVSLSLLRARWVPIGPGAPALKLARRELAACVLIVAVALAGLVAIVGPEDWSDPTTWVFAVAVVLSVAGSLVRALAERIGLELRAYAVEWSLPIGAVLGATLLGRGAFGPALGTTVGLLVGIVALGPSVFGGSSPADPDAPLPPPSRTRWLLVDTLAYVNLGLLDSALSGYVFADGGLALLNYGFLFVNAALVVPSAAATIVSLRIAGTQSGDAHARLGRWAVLAGLLVALVVLAAWAMLGWEPIATRVDGAAGWPVTEGIRPIVLLSVPFAALRLANTVGRQWLVAHDPRRLVPYDLAGVGTRTLVLVFAGPLWGIVASPIGLTLAELLQLAAWVRVRRDAAASG